MAAIVSLSQSVRDAFKQKRPVVALESTVIAHGLPNPVNVKTALACENEIRSRGAEPATVGIIDGAPVIGLNVETIHAIGTRRDVEKVNLSNLSSTISSGRWGATTVAATMRLCHFAGITVFSTGGIGGIHRDYSTTGDMSADLTALRSIPMIVVCSGAKSILDLPRTLEFLETSGVPVVGLGTNEFPAFHSRSSGLAVDYIAKTPSDVAEIAVTHWRLGARTAILAVVPVPAEFEIPSNNLQSMVNEAIQSAAEHGVRGKAVTPYLLGQLEHLSGGATLRANTALLINNAGHAADIATALRG
ncbi:MAG TPA: pseudouridine-5'-phosphate glycosidase [Blastocatellia bacterium]|nr:pseudouridine-5'-phosphate glycosidase [Blastocatellia bacterium]